MSNTKASDIVNTFVKIQRGGVVAEIVFSKGHMDLTKTVLTEIRGYIDSLLTRIGDAHVEGKKEESHNEVNPQRVEATKKQSGNKATTGSRQHLGSQIKSKPLTMPPALLTPRAPLKRSKK